MPSHFNNLSWNWSFWKKYISHKTHWHNCCQQTQPRENMPQTARKGQPQMAGPESLWSIYWSSCKIQHLRSKHSPGPTLKFDIFWPFDSATGFGHVCEEKKCKCEDCNIPSLKFLAAHQPRELVTNQPSSPSPTFRKMINTPLVTPTWKGWALCPKDLPFHRGW